MFTADTKANGMQHICNA